MGDPVAAIEAIGQTNLSETYILTEITERRTPKALQPTAFGRREGLWLNQRPNVYPYIRWSWPLTRAVNG